MTDRTRLAALACAALAACAAPSEHATPEWTLTETLRIGGAEEGPTSFTTVKGIAVDARGRIHVYDRATQDIRVFSADGGFLRVIGRKGSGPGELRDAEGIAFAPDGRLWARDAANARFTIFDADGAYETSWAARFCTSQGLWAPAVDPAGRFVDEDCIVEDRRAVGYAILAYRTDRSGVDTLGTRPECGTQALAEAATWITIRPNSRSFQQIPWAPRAQWTVDPGGALWCAPNSSRFEILRLRPGASDTLRIARASPGAPVTPAERDSVIAAIEARGPTGLDFSRIPAAKPALERLTVDDRGRLWVRRASADRAVTFEVFDSTGVALGHARLGVLRTGLYHPFVVRGDDLYAVVLGEDDLQHVVRYRIGRP